MPGHNIQKYLFDIIEAGERIYSFISGKEFDQYKNNVMLQSAVERQFEIIGEALKLEPEINSQ
jgi:uncharacterized protein with HEPN domain